MFFTTLLSLFTLTVAFPQTPITKISPWDVVSLESLPNYQLRVKDTQGLCEDAKVKQTTGFLDVDDDKHFFFWFFQSRNSPSTDPLVLWLNGGPGCSSMTGLFMELGPCRPQEGGNGTTLNRWSWNNRANVIFLDQPVNAGFSYSDSGNDVTDTESAAKDVHAFLRLFLKKYPEYASLPFHVFGESYAGHYIPAIGHEIAEGNKKFEEEKKKKPSEPTPPSHRNPPAHPPSHTKINLVSLGIGNGLVDPLTQYDYYIPMACENKDYPPVLDEGVCDDMRSKLETCKKLIAACYQYQNAITCVPSSIYCNSAELNPYVQSGRNPYDVRKDCEGGNLCYPILGDIESYLNRDDVRAKLGIDPDRKFISCNTKINGEFLMKGDWMKPFHTLLPPLLEEGIKVLIYAGDADFICNWMGNKAWTIDLDWTGHEDFKAQKDIKWKGPKGQNWGEWRKQGPLSWLKVREAGHMVPYDQPEASADFFEKWIAGRDF